MEHLVHLLKMSVIKTLMSSKTVQMDSCVSVCRLKHNCTLLEDYIVQGDLLKQNFSDKGYPPTLIQEAYPFPQRSTPLKSQGTCTTSDHKICNPISCTTQEDEAYFPQALRNIGRPPPETLCKPGTQNDVQKS